MPFTKKLGNILFSKAITNITGLKITDAQTGFRAFTRKVAEEIELISDHTYTQEQVIKASRKFKIKEIPVRWKETPNKKRRSLISIFKFSADNIFKISLR